MSTFHINNASQVVIVSGMPASPDGTGRLVAHLHDRMAEHTGGRIRLVSRPDRLVRWRIMRWLRDVRCCEAYAEMLRHFYRWVLFWLSVSRLWFRRDEVLILIHPQNLGYRLAWWLLKSRAKKPLVFLLDSSFFCIASYNHLNGENAPCLRCMELGFEQSKNNGCRPFPRLDWKAVEYTRRFQKLVMEGRVHIAAQNSHQAQLAKEHFQLPALPAVIGLWTQDWDNLFPCKGGSDISEPEYLWDVLFHGHGLDAKGARWAVSVAEHCPEVRFMFPFPKLKGMRASKNCSFVPCTWDSGLHDEVGRSRFVIVPSLWSAPIEGALVKSIACADAVAVVENHTSFSDELPDGLVLRLPADVIEGAKALSRACKDNWRPDPQVRARWLEDFSMKKDDFMTDLLDSALSH